MNKWREKFACFVTRLNCFVNGHSNVVILTRYDEDVRLKFTGDLTEVKNKGLKLAKVCRVKAKCGQCKRIFLDYSGTAW